jgi:hypothetical protein
MKWAGGCPRGRGDRLRIDPEGGSGWGQVKFRFWVGTGQLLAVPRMSLCSSPKMGTGRLFGTRLGIAGRSVIGRAAWPDWRAMPAPITANGCVDQRRQQQYSSDAKG